MREKLVPVRLWVDWARPQGMREPLLHKVRSHTLIQRFERPSAELTHIQTMAGIRRFHRPLRPQNLCVAQHGDSNFLISSFGFPVFRPSSPSSPSSSPRSPSRSPSSPGSSPGSSPSRPSSHSSPSGSPGSPW